MKRFLSDRVTLHSGDCLAVLPTLAENSVDSVVTDPPYHLHSIVKRFGASDAAPAKHGTDGAFSRASAGFMGKAWDGGDVAFRPETWAEVLRVMKPGAYLLAFSSSRTFGRMSVAIEDAGFITHPFIAWIFGSGFPKAHRVHAEGWEGWRYGGQSLKPAMEPIYMGQKPFSEGNGTANVLRWCAGALNIDACRVEASDGASRARPPRTPNEIFDRGRGTNLTASPHNEAGRWPANVIHDGSEEVLRGFPDGTGQSGPEIRNRETPKTDTIYGKFGELSRDAAPHDRPGNASRFFYTAKADSTDRIGSRHPTVKPLDLMQYLCRLVTPPRGTILDPFAGTGTTAEAAWREGFNAVLIEREAEYLADIERRMALCLAGPDERARESIKARLKDKPEDHGPLFGDAAA